MKETNGEEEGGMDGCHVHGGYREVTPSLAGSQVQQHLSLASLTCQRFRCQRYLSGTGGEMGFMGL